MPSPNEAPSDAAAERERPDPLELPGVRSDSDALDVEVLIVGAGISGIGTGIELLRRKQRSFMLLEAAGDLGGTWRDNTYPGVAVDIPSISYCFSFETDYKWSRVFAPGSEIQDYVRHCAAKYGVEPHIRYGAAVEHCEFDASKDIWSTTLAGGTVLRSRFVVAATGILCQPKYPDVEGLDSFAGKMMHTARWDHDFELEGKRVGIIGTGASAVQIVPAIAKRVSNLEVFQRTPIWVSKRPDYKLDHSGVTPRNSAAGRATMRFFTELFFEVGTYFITTYKRWPWLVGGVEKRLGDRIRAVVDDPEVADKLVPSYGMGCKRPAISNSYLQSFNRDDVQLVTEGIERVCPEGVITRDGKLHALDAILLATGFLTTERKASPSFDVVGLDGLELSQFWEDNRLQAYAGVSVPRFPNFFLTSGPYSGGFNWFAMLEAHLLHIMQCMDAARSKGVTRVEVEQATHDRYMAHMWKRSDIAVFKDDKCVAANSYYLDRHGDASLPFPRTPFWRWVRVRAKGASGYHFGS